MVNENNAMRTLFRAKCSHQNDFHSYAERGGGGGWEVTGRKRYSESHSKMLRYNFSGVALLSKPECISHSRFIYDSVGIIRGSLHSSMHKTVCKQARFRAAGKNVDITVVHITAICIL